MISSSSCAKIIQDVRLAYATYAESQRTLGEAREKLLPLQKQQLDQTERAYQAGDVDLATLLLAQNDYQLGLSRMVDLSAKLATARIKLSRAHRRHRGSRRGGFGLRPRSSGDIP